MEVLGHRGSRASAIMSIDRFDDAEVLAAAFRPTAVQRRKVDACDEDMWPERCVERRESAIAGCMHQFGVEVRVDGQFSQIQIEIRHGIPAGRWRRLQLLGKPAYARDLWNLWLARLRVQRRPARSSGEFVELGHFVGGHRRHDRPAAWPDVDQTLRREQVHRVRTGVTLTPRLAAMSGGDSFSPGPNSPRNDLAEQRVVNLLLQRSQLESARCACVGAQTI